MSHLYSVNIDKTTDIVRVSGELTFETVREAVSQTDRLFQSLKILDIDLSGVSRSDSAGVALLIHWIRTSNESNKKIIFHNIPSQMLAIADASGLSELLPT